MDDAVCSDKASTQIGSLSTGWLQNRLGLRINDQSPSLRQFHDLSASWP